MLPVHLTGLRPVLDPRYVAYVAQNPEPAGALFGSPTAAAIVSLLSLHPGEGFSLVDLELWTGASYESLHRVLRRLERSSILSIERAGRSHTVVMPGGPMSDALRVVTLQLGPLGSRLRWARRLLGPGSVEEAFVFGSIATSTEWPDSDIDLFLVGEATVGTLLAHLGGLADTLRRDIAPVCHTRESLDRGLSEHLSFLTTVWTGERITVIGRDPSAAA
jgi:Polymerase beta, Nucleotidyltransferase